VIPSALGGRLSFEGILCADCNAGLGDTVDAALVKELDELRMALGVQGDRGQTASVRATSERGVELILDSGAVPRGVDGKPRILAENEDGSKEIRFSSRRAVRQYVAAHVRRNPGAEPFIRRAERVRVYPGPTRLNISFGSDASYRSAVKSALSLTIGRSAPVSRDALANAWRYVKGATPEASGVRVGLAAMSDPWREVPLSMLSHRIAVRLKDGCLRLDVRYFGAVGMAADIAVAFDGDWSAAYAIDPLTRVVHLGPIAELEPVPEATEELFGYHRRAIVARIDEANRAAEEAVLTDIAEEAQRMVQEGLKPGEVPPPERVAEVERFKAEEEKAFRLGLETRHPAPADHIDPWLPQKPRS
jgi:hypothetical protein